MAQIEGSIFASRIDDEVVHLHEELLESGHFLGLSKTAEVTQEPIYRSGRRVVVGTDAIRTYFGMKPDVAPSW